MDACAAVIALILDHLLGEPRRFHPLVGFGWLATRAEACWYAPTRFRGVLVVLAVITPWAFMAAWVSGMTGWMGEVGNVLLLYLVIGARSLAQHALLVARALEGADLALGRLRVGWMVSRETGQLDESGVALAAVESVLENGNDAIFAPLFWFFLLGAPGAVIYRLVNTLDALWGYKTPRYRSFGWAAARLDDGLNWFPARLTVAGYAVVGRLVPAIGAAFRVVWESPNAGVVMAAGAGALGLTLGGTASYHGELRHRPHLGAGGPFPGISDIRRAVALVKRSTLVWAVAACGIGGGPWLLSWWTLA